MISNSSLEPQSWSCQKEWTYSFSEPKASPLLSIGTQHVQSLGLEVALGRPH